jgi:hypothetical protein
MRVIERPKSMKPADNLSAGSLVADVLKGAWRTSPPDLHFSEAQLDVVTPLLLSTGCGGLGWRRIRTTSLARSARAEELRFAYYKHTLQSELHWTVIAQTVELLRSTGADFMLGKGWAVARCYDEPGLRPFGDIDLYIRPKHYRAAVEALNSAALTPEAVALTGVDAPVWPVDLHRGCPDLGDRSFDTLLRRSEPVKTSGVELNVLAPEDHLRLLCLHALRHGACRPLWMCDLSVVIESRKADFDWDRFLAGDRLRADWALCALALANVLVGADLAGTPVENRVKLLPEWLITAVLREWSEVKVPHGSRAPLSWHLKQPSGLLRALRIRWPNAIEATINIGGPCV